MTDARRILILAPHPDDEVVGCAIAATRARQAGARLFTLYLTTGLPARELMWSWRRGSHGARVARRREEARAAAHLLGLEPLGFQDWPARTLKSHLEDALALIRSTLATQAIDALWVPAFEGGHQDHDATNLLASRLAERVSVTEFAEYHFAGGATRLQRFVAETGAERVIGLSPEEAHLKRAALALYRSERANLAGLRGEAEALRPLAPYDYGRPPHAGRLFFARFQWVPFRHPRVDCDPPEAVYAALGRFAAETPDPGAARA